MLIFWRSYHLFNDHLIIFPLKFFCLECKEYIMIVLSSTAAVTLHITWVGKRAMTITPPSGLDLWRHFWPLATTMLSEQLPDVFILGRGGLSHKPYGFLIVSSLNYAVHCQGSITWSVSLSWWAEFSQNSLCLAYLFSKIGNSSSLR